MSRMQAVRRWTLSSIGLAMSLIATQSGFVSAKTPVPTTCTYYDQFTWYAYGNPYDTVHGATPIGPFSGYSYDFTQPVTTGTYHSDALGGTIASEHTVVAPVSCS